MDSLSFLGSLEDINQELSTLPNGLDQAYVVLVIFVLCDRSPNDQIRPHIETHRRTFFANNKKTSKKDFGLGRLLKNPDAKARDRSCTFYSR